MVGAHGANRCHRTAGRGRRAIHAPVTGALENLALKRTVRDQETEVRSLADKLAAARENNRFADRRIADLETRIAEPQLGQGNEVGQHSANGKP
jgi:hypothetical protein